MEVSPVNVSLTHEEAAVMVAEAVAQERKRVLKIHELVRNSACVAQFRKMVKAGVTTEEAEAEINRILAERRTGWTATQQQQQ